MELNPDEPARAVTPQKVMSGHDPSHEWERFGEHNEDATNSYVMGTYVADDPLGPFTYQPGPICESRDGLIQGAGHGCVIHGHAHDDGDLWAFYTCGAQVTHDFERRVGMAPARIEDGRLMVSPVSDRPVSTTGRDAGLVPVNRAKPVTASSSAPGRSPFHAADGELRTWWQPAAEDGSPTLTFDLWARFEVEAMRLCWAEPGLDHDDGRPPRPVVAVLELRDGNGPWREVTRTGDRELLIDARVFASTPATAARLRIEQRPFEIGVADLTLFARPAR